MKRLRAIIYSHKTHKHTICIRFYAANAGRVPSANRVFCVLPSRLGKLPCPYNDMFYITLVLKKAINKICATSASGAPGNDMGFFILVSSAILRDASGLIILIRKKL